MSRAVRPREYNHHIDKRAASLLTCPAAAGSDDEMLDTVEVANWLQTSSQWVHAGRRNPRYGPEFEQLTSTKIAYRRGAVKAWLRERAKRLVAA